MTAPRIAVIDYGMGNLRSVAKALEVLGARVQVSSSRTALRSSDGIVLPGVGAFGEAMRRLRRAGLASVIRSWIEKRRPFLGVCLGLQLMFEESEEFGRHRGLGCFPGRVIAFPPRKRVPHMGWNGLAVRKREGILAGLPRSPYVYFVHTYYPVPADRAIVSAWTRYGRRFASAIEDGPVAGVQFHPEKSQRIGVRILRNFVRMVTRFA